MMKEGPEKRLVEYEKLLEETRGYLASIIESSADAIASIDLNGVIRSWNRGAERLLGYKAEEIIGKHYYKIIPKELRKEVEGLRKEALEKGFARKETYRLHKDGRKIPVDLTISVVKDSEGKLIGTSGVFKDLREKKKLEQELREVAEFLKSTFNAITDGISVLDKDFTVIDANPGMLKAYNLKDRDELIGKKCYEVYQQRNEICPWCPSKLAFETGKPHYNRVPGKDAQGNIIYWDLYVYPVFDEKGDVIRVIEYARNVTEQAKLEQELREARDHFEGILDTIKEEICVIDRDFNIISFNEAFAKRLKSPKLKEKCYKVLHGYTHEDFLKFCEHRCVVKRALEKGEVVESVHKHILEDGRAIHHECKALPSKDDKGGVYQVVYVINDVTEKKILEEELRSYTLQLERSNQLKGLLIDIMIHDLLNSITGIKGFAGILAEEELLKDFKEDLEGIDRNMEKLEEIIEDCRKFARLEEVEALKFEERDLAGIIGEAIQSLQPIADTKNIEIALDVEHKCPAHVNPFMKDVFSNLLSNAIKYSPEGSRVVVRILDGDGKWKVAVKDYGEGVPDEYKERIFERFKRGGKEGVKGTGLGLAIVKRVVEMHEGKVWVEDNPEGGSIFYVSLPKERVVG
jgi:PAS domain S-box-containing protein